MNFYLFVVLPIVLTMACVSAPSTIQPKLAVSVPELWTSSATPSGVIDPEWWSDFNDPGLDASVRTALDRNYDLHAAAARLELTAANSRITGADLKPSVQLGFNSSRRKQNFIGLPIPGREGFVLSTISTNLGVSLDVSWEVDLWGRIACWQPSSARRSTIRGGRPSWSSAINRWANRKSLLCSR